MQPSVRPERTEWRDEGISKRHRLWGFNCPAVDIDFLVIEYDRGRPAAIVEFKHERAAPQQATHPSYQAMIHLGDAAQIPVFACRYSDDYSEYRAVPLNGHAARFLPKRARLSERGWVELLYRVRGRPAPADLFNHQGNLI